MTHRALLQTLVLAAATTAAAAGCDVEPTSAIDYDVVAHVELSSLTSAPWAQAAMRDGNFNLSLHGDGKGEGDFDSKACKDLLKSADALTVGAGHDRVEIYLQGAVDPKTTKACFDELKAHVLATKDDAGKRDTIRTAQLADDLVAVAIGSGEVPTPTRTRLGDLIAADPSPSGAAPMWLTVHPATSDDEIAYIEGWANPRKGLDGHLHVEMKDAATATELHAQVALALTALKLSGEIPELGKILKVGVAGEVISADVHATATQMRAVMASGSAEDHDDDAGASIAISFGD